MCYTTRLVCHFFLENDNSMTQRQKAYKKGSNGGGGGGRDREIT
jgi:hypothetical protein